MHGLNLESVLSSNLGIMKPESTVVKIHTENSMESRGLD